MAVDLHRGLGAWQVTAAFTTLAETIAKAGWSKADLKRYLFDHVRIPAWEFERYVIEWMDQGYSTLTDAVAQGLIPPIFAESNDPTRLVPIVFTPEHFMVVVSGDPLRTNAYVFSHNGIRGFTVAKKIQLPKNWENLRPHSSSSDVLKVACFNK